MKNVIYEILNHLRNPYKAVNLDRIRFNDFSIRKILSGCKYISSGIEANYFFGLA